MINFFQSSIGADLLAVFFCLLICAAMWVFAEMVYSKPDHS